jgi:UDP-glucuronate decarboxylase
VSGVTTPADGDQVVMDDLRSITARLESEFDEMARDSLLLVGGGGFLGYYLVQSIGAWNEQHPDRQIFMTIYDSWIRGRPEWLRTYETAIWLEIETVDITEPLPVNTPGFDWIIHAASIASPTFYREYPIETMDANVNGLRNLLEHARAKGEAGSPVKGFLFFSTSEIYGDPTPDAIPTPETYRGHVSCTGPRACYDESKRYGETLSVNFARVHGLPVKIARPFNNYGPGLKIGDGRVIPDFARDILAGDDIVMHSSGEPTRTFCYIADAVVGYYKILVRGRAGEPYNIGTDSPEISIAELAHRMATLAQTELGYEGRVIQRPSEDSEYLVDNPNRRCPDITKARKELRYEPEVPIDEGLRRSLLWYRDQETAQVT